MEKTTSHFRLNKPAKRILATLSGNERSVFKKAAISAQVNVEKNPRMTMMYDIDKTGRKVNNKAEKND